MRLRIGIWSFALRTFNEAVTASAEMLRSLRDPMFWNGEDWTMSVTDETGEELFSLRFSGQMKAKAAA
jgi:hypothetical protein